MSAKSKPKLLIQETLPFPGRGIIQDLSGLPVDADSAVWLLNDATQNVILDWRRLPIQQPALLEACVAYAAQLVQFYRPRTVRGWFETLTILMAQPRFVHDDVAGGELSYQLFSEFLEFLGKSNRYQGQRLKEWYSWCCDQGFPHFDSETAFRLNEITYGGNEKGRAVLSLDPEDGPLSDREVVSLLSALRSSEHTGALSLLERVAIWLCLALGGNPHQYVLLQQGDLQRMFSAEGNEPIAQLLVPRMKKRLARERTEFKARKLTPEIAKMVEELQQESCQRYRMDFQEKLGPSTSVPLFLRKRSRNNDIGMGVQDYAAHMTAAEFSALVMKAIKKLGVISPRTGKVIHATCRRLRYTYATRLVREGASQRVVAEALDHTDLQNVQCYFDLKSDTVEQLDAAMAMVLGPLSQAFLGHLVRRESEAVRGDQRSSRIHHHRPGAPSLTPVGTCGSHSFCRFVAPVACYTCVKFQPWVEAPHGEVLDHLLADRERRKADGLDGKMVALLDTTILAVADVISRVQAYHQAVEAT